jgi:hypothetical protein
MRPEIDRALTQTQVWLIRILSVAGYALSPELEKPIGIERYDPLTETDAQDL